MKAEFVRRMIDSVMLENAQFLMILILILVVMPLYYLFRFIFQPTRDLMAQPPIFFILLTAMGLGWLVWKIKYTRFMVRFIVTGFKLCPQTHSLLDKLLWYRKVLVVTWRLHRLQRLHDKGKKEKRD